MAKIKLKLSGFELEVEADKDEIPAIAQNLAKQFSGLIEPAAAIATNAPPRKTVVATDVTPPALLENAEKVDKDKLSGRGRGKRTATASASKQPPIKFVHDIEKWGYPLQSFTSVEKAVYTIYVVEQMTQQTEMSAGQIASTFNEVFKRAGTIRGSNVSKYLGEAAAAKPALVNEDTTKSPAQCFLTTEGRRAAEQLVVKARGTSTEKPPEDMFNGSN